MISATSLASRNPRSETRIGKSTGAVPLGLPTVRICSMPRALQQDSVSFLYLPRSSFTHLAPPKITILDEREFNGRAAASSPTLEKTGIVHTRLRWDLALVPSQSAYCRRLVAEQSARFAKRAAIRC